LDWLQWKGGVFHGTGERVFQGYGYKVEWHVVNAGQFVSQYRERVYIVGSLRELNCPDMQWENIYPDDENVERPPILRDLLEKDYATNPTIVDYCELSQRQWEKLQQIHGKETIPTARLKTEDYAPILISTYHEPVSSSSTRFVFDEFDRPMFLSPRDCGRIVGGFQRVLM